MTVDAAEDGGTLRDGYMHLLRTWQPGNQVRITFDMPVRRVRAHPRLRDAAGRVALARGPFIYCMEGTDHAAPLSALILPEDAPVQPVLSDLAPMGSIVTLHAEGRRQRASDALYASGAAAHEPSRLHFIPYYAWGNRDAGDMAVWVREA